MWFTSTIGVLNIISEPLFLYLRYVDSADSAYLIGTGVIIAITIAHLGGPRNIDKNLSSILLKDG